eukprot:1920503-Prymnesium_polylepis.1
MPGETGDVFLLEVRRTWSALAVVMISSYAEPGLIRACIRHGADDFLEKPVSMQSIELLWKHCLKRQPSFMTRNHSFRSKLTKDREALEGHALLSSAAYRIATEEPTSDRSEDCSPPAAMRRERAQPQATLPSRTLPLPVPPLPCAPYGERDESRGTLLSGRYTLPPGSGRMPMSMRSSTPPDLPRPAHREKSKSPIRSSTFEYTPLEALPCQVSRSQGSSPIQFGVSETRKPPTHPRVSALMDLK